MNPEALVSVVIPVYNGAAYLSKAIDSILAQTHSRFELLICDDGSTDESAAIAHAAAARDSRIKVLANEENKGHIYTYNRLFHASGGEYIMVLDADDWSSADRIALQLSAIEENGADVCFCNSIYYTPGSGESYPRPDYPSGMLDIESPEHYDPATIFFKRSILDTIPGYHPYFDRLVAMDRYFILECICNFKCYYLNERLYHVLMRPDSDHRSIDERYMRKMTALEAYRLLKQQRQETGTDWLLEGKEDQLLAYEQGLLNDKAYMSEKYRNFSCIQIDNNILPEGWRLLKKAILLRPLSMVNYKTLLYLSRKLLAAKITSSR